MTSYGKYGCFEIRDVEYLGEKPKDKPAHEYDLVCWENVGEENQHCFSIGKLWWDEKEHAFEF